MSDERRTQMPLSAKFKAWFRVILSILLSGFAYAVQYGMTKQTISALSDWRSRHELLTEKQIELLGEMVSTLKSHDKRLDRLEGSLYRR